MALRFRLARQQATGETLAGGVALVALAAALVAMLLRAASGTITLGDLALFYQAFNQGQRVVRAMLGSVSQIYGNTLFLENLHDFFALAVFRG